MRRMLFTSAAIAAALTMGLGACGDDGDKGTTDTTQADTVSPGDTVGGDDTTGDATSNPDATGDTTGDTVVADPCTPNPCTHPPAPSCDGDGKLVTAGATGTCTANGAVPECAYTTTAVACETDEVCATGACIAAGDPCEYEFAEAASVVTELKIASLGSGTPPSDDCCFDFTGDGKVDNKLAGVLKLLGSAVGDLNGTLQEQIDAGTIVILLEEKDLDDLTADSSVTLNGFLGAPTAGAKLGAEADGLGTFTVTNSSFLAGTAVPLIAFEQASITASVLTAGPAVFALSIPLGGTAIEIRVSDTRVEGKVATGPNGKGLTLGALEPNDLGAKLGGVVTQTDLYAALNGYVASCAVVTDDDNQLISFNSSNGKWECAASANVNTDACESDDPVKTVVAACGLALPLMKPDVDTNGDTVPDALSIGIWLNATSATLAADPACTPLR